MNLLANSECVLLALIRAALNKSYADDQLAKVLGSLTQDDWIRVARLAAKQSVVAMAYDGLEAVVASAGETFAAANRQNTAWWSDFVIEWGSQVLFHESNYAKYEKAVHNLATFYTEHDMRMLVLKGYGLSLLWPKPNHRPTGEIDIVLLGDEAWKKGDMLIHDELGIEVDNSLPKHSVFKFQGYAVENHFTFLSVHGHQSTARAEKYLKGLPEDYIVHDSMLFPSADFNALFLLRHMAEHFASVDMSLRLLMDWAMFVKAYSNDIHWDVYLDMIRSLGMERFLAVVNAICMEDFGLDRSLFPDLPIDAALKERVLNDIIAPEFKEKAPKAFLPGIAFKIRRWKANLWKHNIVFSERPFVSFLTQTWSHLLKPSTLKN